MKKHPSLNYFADLAGNIYNGSKEYLEAYEAANGYLVVDSYHVHILVAEIFLGHTKGNGLVVNHKNGVKTDPRVRNLELVTYSGNAEHAFRTGLRPDNIRVQTKDVLTNEITTFYSMAQCARSFGCDTAVIKNAMLPSNRGKLFKQKYLIIKEGQQWSEPVPPGSHQNGHQRAFVVSNIPSNSKQLFVGLKGLAEKFGLRPATLQQRLQRAKDAGHDKIVIGDSEIAYATERDLVVISDPVVSRYKRPDLKGFRKPLKVLVTEDGVTSEYESLKSFCESKGFSFDAVAAAIYRKGRYKQFELSYVPQAT